MSFQSARKFKPEEDGIPHGWIQWKGTDVCMDFHCRCGAHGHVDDSFAYFVKCGACGQLYEMSGHVEAMPVDQQPPETCDAVTARVDSEDL